jgi:signal transduction histidine kinase/CheY-like chemotaxis protein
VKDLQKLLHLWVLSTTVFIVIAALGVGAVLAYRFNEFNKARRGLTRDFVELQLMHNYAAITEETYLSLNSLKSRENDLQRLLGESATVTMAIVPVEPSDLRNLSIGTPSSIEWEASITNISQARVPLFFGDIPVGNLIVTITWLESWLNIASRDSFLPGSVVLTILGIWVGLFLILRKKLIRPLFIDVMKLQRESAIAQMTSMLAHDVRKPFSMLKTGLNLLQATSNDPSKFKSNLAFLVSEVDRATKSVDGMLTDVMEIGSTSTALIQEPASPEALIESTLGEVFRVYPKSKIAISYDLKHTAMVNVHVKKVSRVFSNIVGNAVQAMNYSGSMWFKTEDDGPFVQFCIGNAGSVIPPDNLDKLFEAFFTSGKKGGTGLGLAIAQKVVQAHEGKIWCESSKTPEHPEGKVEFFFTLPIAAGVDLVTTANLPKHSDEITQMITLMGQASKSMSDSEFNRSEGLLHREVVQRARALPRPLGLLIVDDELIYRSALSGWIGESPELTNVCNVFHANGSVEALAALTNQSIDLIITDIDMGPKSLSGFDLLKELRTTHAFKGLIFVHSNRIVSDDHRKAGDLGANGFLPKPMAKGQLFKLFLQTIQYLSPQVDTVTPTSGTDKVDSKTTADTDAKLSFAGVEEEEVTPYNLIAVIDDEDIFRNQWPDFLKDFDTVCYATAEEFIEDWDQVSGKLIAVLTDKYLGPGIDGIKLGTMLKQKARDLPIILSTSDMASKNESNIFDLIVDKDAFEEAPKIIQYLKNKTQDENLIDLMRKTIRSFTAQANDLKDPITVTTAIDSHLKTWKFLIKEWDSSTEIQLRKAMLNMDFHKLQHDIKGSITRLKILLRNHELGEIDKNEVMTNLKDRITNLGNL